MVVNEGDEVLHATSSHEALEVTGVQIRSSRFILLVIFEKGFLVILTCTQASHFPGLLPPQFRSKPNFFILKIFL